MVRETVDWRGGGDVEIAGAEIGLAVGVAVAGVGTAVAVFAITGICQLWNLVENGWRCLPAAEACRAGADTKTAGT